MFLKFKQLNANPGQDLVLMANDINEIMQVPNGRTFYTLLGLKNGRQYNVTEPVDTALKMLKKALDGEEIRLITSEMINDIVL